MTPQTVEAAGAVVYRFDSRSGALGQASAHPAAIFAATDAMGQFEDASDFDGATDFGDYMPPSGLLPMLRRIDDSDPAPGTDGFAWVSNLVGPGYDQRMMRLLGSLEVCLVHRPKYRDWSWPKGKLKGNESSRHAAVREVEEETGCAIELSAPLGDVTYALNDDGTEGRRKVPKSKPKLVKHVAYWVARPIDATRSERRAQAFGPVIQADKAEIDNVEWMSLAEAYQRLTYNLDRMILRRFIGKVLQGVLWSSQVILVRHGKAEGRKVWEGTDANRPLTPRGAAASFALSRELACYDVLQLASSSWIRCRQTVQPFATMMGMTIRNEPTLTEDAFAEDPARAVETIDRTIRRSLIAQHSIAVSMHRPVFRGIFPHLAEMCANKKLAKTLPQSSPYMPTGHGFAFTVVPAGADEGHAPCIIIAIEKIEPVVY